MARSIQNKVIRSKPNFTSLTPSNDYIESAVTISLEEWETIRLVDYNDLSQQEASYSMKVSRQTVQALLQSARKKVARSLVEAIPLNIKGGNFIESTEKERKNSMKIAATFSNEEIFQHFGRTPFFAIYNIENGKIENKEIIKTPEEGHGALVGFLVENGIETLICGGIGGGAVNALQQSGVDLYAGASGNADLQVISFISGQLPHNEFSNCNHHDHDHGEEGCHGHGHHSHGHNEENCHGHGHHSHGHNEENCHGHGHHNHGHNEENCHGHGHN